MYPARYTIFQQVEPELSESDPIKEIERITKKLHWGERLLLNSPPGIKVFSQVSIDRLRELETICKVTAIEDCKTDEEYIVVKIDNKILHEFYWELRERYSIPNWNIGKLDRIEISKNGFRLVVCTGDIHPATLSEFEKMVKQAKKIAKVFGRNIHEFYIERRVFNYVHFY